MAAPCYSKGGTATTPCSDVETAFRASGHAQCLVGVNWLLCGCKNNSLLKGISIINMNAKRNWNIPEYVSLTHRVSPVAPVHPRSPHIAFAGGGERLDRRFAVCRVFKHRGEMELVEGSDDVAWLIMPTCSGQTHQNP